MPYAGLRIWLASLRSWPPAVGSGGGWQQRPVATLVEAMAEEVVATVALLHLQNLVTSVPDPTYDSET